MESGIEMRILTWSVGRGRFRGNDVALAYGERDRETSHLCSSHAPGLGSKKRVSIAKPDTRWQKCYVFLHDG